MFNWYKNSSNIHNEPNTVIAQWGSGEGKPKLPIWSNKSWVSDTYQSILESEGDQPAGISTRKEIPQRRPEAPETPEEPAAPSNDTGSSANIVLESAVTINSTVGDKTEMGSGFFITENIVLTCAHVCLPTFPKVDPNTTPKITVKHKDVEYQAAVWAYDVSIDAAVLMVNDPNFKSSSFLKLSDSNQANIGEKIVVIGSPLGFDNIVGEGIISSKPVDYQDEQQDRSYIFISSNIAPGNSGGPVALTFDSSVIGIAAAIITDQQTDSSGLNAVIPAEAIKPFLKNNGIKFSSSGGA